MPITNLLRSAGRWLMNGPRRRRAYETLNRRLPALLGNRVRRGPGAGLRFTEGDTIGYVLGVSEPAVQKVLVDHLGPGSVLYDVGAHAGFMTLIGCRLVGPGGRVHAFDPITDNIQKLRRNITANGFGNATLHELALSDTDGPVRMARGTRHITAHLDEAGETIVSAARCDSLTLEPPTVIKIDVEGAEGKVLAGMEKTLRQHRPVVVVEVHGAHCQALVERLLARAGYSIEMLNTDGMPHLLATPGARRDTER